MFARRSSSFSSARSFNLTTIGESLDSYDPPTYQQTRTGSNLGPSREGQLYQWETIRYFLPDYGVAGRVTTYRGRLTSRRDTTIVE